MIDSVFAPKMAPYIVNAVLTKLYIVLFVDVLWITLQRKTKKSEINYRLKTMLATVNRSSTPFISFAFVVSTYAIVENITISGCFVGGFDGDLVVGILLGTVVGALDSG